MAAKTLLSWSSGKDCAWMLHLLRQQSDVEVVGLVTTFNEVFNRVAMHGVRMELVEAQAAAANLPLWSIPLPWPCSNDVYEQRMNEVIARARSQGITVFGFGTSFFRTSVHTASGNLPALELTQFSRFGGRTLIPHHSLSR